MRAVDTWGVADGGSDQADLDLCDLVAVSRLWRRIFVGEFRIDLRFAN